MYLVISTSNLDIKQNFYSISGIYYENVKQIFPLSTKLTVNDVENIIIYSCSKTNSDKYAKFAKCVGIEITDNSLKVFYEETDLCDVTCKDVKGRIYGNLVRKGRIQANSQVPFVTLIENINDYIYICCKYNKQTECTSLLRKIEELKIDNEWNSIVNMFPEFETIKETEYWGNSDLLSELAYALSHLVFGRDKINKKEYAKYFFSVSNRCMEIMPMSHSYKSVRAYFHYCSYIGQISYLEIDEYEEAMKYYGELIINSPERYKEFYRYIKLKQRYFRLNEWNLGKNRDVMFNEICDGFETLIKDYEELDEDRKKRYKKHYISSLYGYSVFNMETIYKYFWDKYYNKTLFNNVISQSRYLIYNQTEQQLFYKIAKCGNYLETINLLRTDRNINYKNPSYFDLKYRIAQINLVKGIVYVLKHKNKSACDSLFEETFKISEELLIRARELHKRGRWKGNYPDYVKPIKAKALYFLGRYEECHKCFYKAKKYMLYEQAQIYALCNESEKALEILKQIPENDNCSNKAKELIEVLKDYDI